MILGLVEVEIKRFLFCHVTLRFHRIKETYDLLSRRPLPKFNTLQELVVLDQFIFGPNSIAHQFQSLKITIENSTKTRGIN